MMATILRSLNWQRFFRGEGAEAGPITLDRRRVFILPTRGGLVFALVLLAMLLGAMNYDKSLAYALVFLLAGMALVSILHTFRNLNGVRFRAGRALPAFAGEAARFELLLENPSARPRYALSVGRPAGPFRLVDLPAGATLPLEIERPSHQRGQLDLGRVVVATRFPLGLFRAWSHVTLHHRTVIYPAPSGETSLPEPDSAGGGVAGDRGLGQDDFVSLRPYRAGDSLKHVHWKAAARGAGLLTKRFGGHRSELLWLTWDRTPGDTEQRLSRLCRGVLDAERAGRTYGLQLPAATLAPDRGDAHQRACLRALALYGVAP